MKAVTLSCKDKINVPVYFRVRPNVFNMENLEIVIQRKLAISLLHFAPVFGGFADRSVRNNPLLRLLLFHPERVFNENEIKVKPFCFRISFNFNIVCSLIKYKLRFSLRD